MMLHPGAIALVCGATIVFLMVLAAALLGVQIIVGWDINSGSQRQLVYERQTYLVSSLVNWALFFEIMSILLFVFTADDMHDLFTGAMCATGTLNANPIGWYVLYCKIFLFFAAAVWLVLNYFDQRAEDYPVVRLKYFLIILLLPVIGVDLFLQVSFFSGLEPEVITSCCGSLFSGSSQGLAGDIVSLPAREMMITFYVSLALLILGIGICFFWRNMVSRTVLLIVGVSFFFVAMVSVISFISLYIYELPTHHCPFDIVQGHYNFIGYPLYISLFAGVLFAILPGIFQLFFGRPTLRTQIMVAEGTWLLLAFGLIVAFGLIASWPIVFGDLILF